MVKYVFDGEIPSFLANEMLLEPGSQTTAFTKMPIEWSCPMSSKIKSFNVSADTADFENMYESG